MEYQLIRSGRRTLSLEIDREARLIVRAPRRVSRNQIEGWIHTKSGWILSKQCVAREQRARMLTRTFGEGEPHLFLGKHYPICFVDEGPTISWNHALRIRREFRGHVKSVLTGWYKDQALKIIPGRVEALAQKYGVPYEKIKLSNAGKRWGSCSPTGTLRFSWRLMMAPTEVIDYVALHELAHIEIKNHGKKFWCRVRDWCPDYRKQVAWLKQHERSLVKD